MKFALIGGTGFVGSAVLEELLSRGHHVTALARDEAKYTPRPGLTVQIADAREADQVRATVGAVDGIVSAYNPGWTNPHLHDEFLAGSRAIIEAAKSAGKRLLIVGGAGSLYVAPGVQLVDTPEFPADWKQGALAARELLNIVRADAQLDWTFLSPAVFLDPGERTGTYRKGAEDVLMDAQGPAHISVKDLAVAIADELETPAHRRARFTVASV